MEAQPTGVLWDIGNVMVRWDPRNLYSKIFPDPVQRDWFLTNICTQVWHTEHDRGRSMAEGVAILTALYPDHAEPIAAWRTRWWEMFDGPIPETTAAIEALVLRGVPMFALTNLSAEIAQGVFDMDPAFRHLRQIVVSGEVGLIKPDPAFFELALSRIDRQAESLLFIDDNPDNIATAEALGFHTHLFQNPAEVELALRAHGLL